MTGSAYTHAFAVGDRVKILTPAGGCYDGATGIITGRLGANLEPYPPGQDPEIPHFYEVRTDRPVDIGGGTMSHEDVHPSRQVFAEDSPIRNYWSIGQKGNIA